MSWTQFLYSDEVYSEEDFEWSIARLLPCPRSFFRLVYSANGVLSIILGAREESIVILDKIWYTAGCCELCCSQLSTKYERWLEEGEYGTYQNSETDMEVKGLCGWTGGNLFCILCFDTAAYVNYYLKDSRSLQLNAYDQLYLDRIGSFRDSVNS